MFKIGDFSRLTQVPIKTLRHYDRLGLFKPARVDSFTGYRYYTYDQLPRLNRILALRGLGFSLRQIARILDSADGLTPSADELRGMFMLRQAQLQQQVAAAQEKLASVAVRLKQIEEEGTMSPIEVLTKPVPALTLVGAREVVAQPALMRERCMALNDQAWAYLQQARLHTDGLSLALYYSSGEQGIDVEMAYRVEASPEVERDAQAAESGDSVRLHGLPAATVAYAVYRGSYDNFGAVGQVHGAIMAWIEANGYRATGPCREYYLRPPSGPDDRTGVMEIQYPIERGSSVGTEGGGFSTTIGPLSSSPFLTWGRLEIML